MPILLVLLGAGLGAGATFFGQAVGILPAPGQPAAPNGGNGAEPTPTPVPTGPVPRSGFLVIPGTVDRNQVKGAIFNSKDEADDFARETAQAMPGVPIWRVTLENDKIVEGTAFQFGFFQEEQKQAG